MAFVSFSDENIKIMNQTRDVLDKYNLTKYEDKNTRIELLKQMFNSVGDDVTIQTPFKITYGKHTSIGNHVFINYNVDILDGGEVIIGNNVMIGPDTKIYSGDHPLKVEDRIKIVDNKMQLVTIPKEVIIEDDVWICGNVTITPGVRIGKGAVVAAGAVVTKDVKPKTLVGGNPAKFIKNID